MPFIAQEETPIWIHLRVIQHLDVEHSLSLSSGGTNPELDVVLCHVLGPGFTNFAWNSGRVRDAPLSSFPCSINNKAQKHHPKKCLFLLLLPPLHSFFFSFSSFFFLVHSDFLMDQSQQIVLLCELFFNVYKLGLRAEDSPCLLM